MTECKFCGEGKDNILINGIYLCETCYRDLVKVHQKVVLKFVDYAILRDNRDFLKEVKEKISDFNYCYDNFRNFTTFICDERLLYIKGHLDVNIFPFVQQIVDINDTWVGTWNKFIELSDSNNLGIAGCKYYQCDKCREWRPLINNQIINGKYCPRCYEEITEKYQYIVLEFFKYLDLKLGTDYRNNVNRLYRSSERCQEYFKSINLRHNDDVFDVIKNIAIKTGCLEEEKRTSDGYCLADNKINVFTAIFNSYLKENKNNDRVFGTPKNFYVYDACKSCGGGISCSAEEDYDDFIRIERDPQAECWSCCCWDSIEGELTKKYGWNYKWRDAISEFVKNGRATHNQADPNKLNIYLKERDIVMTDDVIEFWNNLFEKRRGNHIIKFYAFNDSLAGKAQQEIGRAVGGFFNKLFNGF